MQTLQPRGDTWNTELYVKALRTMDPWRRCGRVTDMVGLLIEANGPAAGIGDFCEIETKTGRTIRAQVIGFRDGRLLAMPLEETDGLHLGDPITARKEDARMEVGNQLLGRVLDGFGGFGRFGTAGSWPAREDEKAELEWRVNRFLRIFFNR